MKKNQNAMILKQHRLTNLMSCDLSGDWSDEFHSEDTDSTTDRELEIPEPQQVQNIQVNTKTS